jgi:membrane-associated phospholipid phosphatase
VKPLMWVVLALLSPLQLADDSMQQAVQSARRPALERPMRTLSDIGRPVVVFGGLLVVAAFDAAAGPSTARLALVALVPTNLVVEGLKWLVNRTRPDGSHRRSNSSFPSSHAANAFALAVILARRYRRAGVLFFLLAVAVAASRVYLNRHYVSDVVVGAAIGAAAAWGVARLQATRARRAAAAH